MRVAGDVQLAAELGAAGRRRVLAEFDWASQVPRWEDLLRSLNPQAPRPGGRPGAMTLRQASVRRPSGP